jgi:hypothetical protein
MLLIHAPLRETFSAGLLPEFGTQRTIFGTHSKVGYETKIEICMDELPFSNEKDPDMCHTPEFYSLAG